ncbi:MAG: hypothetical protein BWZ10_03386 [candidate division BRC1 bacterium ADurb.BinA364]|nr:MAG: hypothetical protein BWZ10_03386 [candidate division BRC1 bacterium ADurb.BinA364]
MALSIRCWPSEISFRRSPSVCWDSAISPSRARVSAPDFWSVESSLESEACSVLSVASTLLWPLCSSPAASAMRACFAAISSRRRLSPDSEAMLFCWLAIVWLRRSISDRNSALARFASSMLFARSAATALSRSISPCRSSSACRCLAISRSFRPALCSSSLMAKAISFFSAWSRPMVCSWSERRSVFSCSWYPRIQSNSMSAMAPVENAAA